MRNLVLSSLVVLGTATSVVADNSIFRFLQAANTTGAPPPLAYASTLRCDECIRSGFVFCVQGTERQEVAPGGTPPSATCCQDATCSQASDSTWTCSSSYSDPVLARSICPFPRDQCGDRPQILLNNTGDAVNVTMNLPPGGVCMYEMRSRCGMPAFMPNFTDGVDIQYLQYDDTQSSPDSPPPPPAARLLQAPPPPPPQNSTNDTMPPPQNSTNGTMPPPQNNEDPSQVDTGFRRPPRNITAQNR